MWLWARATTWGHADTLLLGATQIRATVGLSADVEEPMTPADQSAEVNCQACMCDVPASEVRALRCGHTFCNDCWRDYLEMRVVRCEPV